MGQANYFRCKVCNKLNDLDADFCDPAHMRLWFDWRFSFHRWMGRGTPLLDYYSPAEWEYDFSPLEERT